jgi:ubiquinone biosynthesis protein COQ4
MALYDPGEIRVGDAWQALRALLRDPDDTKQAFRVVDALSGRNGERNLARLRRRKSGKELLRDRPDLLSRLTDRAALQSLPEGTLGREYLRFLDSEGITAEGLLQASADGRRDLKPEVDPDLYFLRDRLRDQHDLWHTVTGYKGDLLGEASLLAFSFAQTWNLGVGLIVLAALVQGRDPAVRKLVASGFARGLRSAWLPAVRWEKLLERPLSEVRRTLRIGAPVAYEPLRTADLKAAEAA